MAFNRLGLPRLLADVELGNAASERILKKLGFQYTRQERIAASGRVIFFYELSRATWQDASGKPAI